MKYILSLSMLCMLTLSILAQTNPPKVNLYNPKDDAALKIQDAVKQAKADGKHVLLQVGGNWCVWCIRFNNYIKADQSLDSLVEKNYVVYHLNWSPENKNEKVLESLGFPQRFGFPVFVILDGEGKRLHTQDSALLEEGESYNKNLVMGFLQNWSKAALLPENNKY